MVENPSPSADERIEVIDPLVNPEWDRFASSHPFASIFHGTPWCRILVETFGYNPRYLVLKDGGTIRAGLPLMAIKSILTGRRLISLPRTSYCDPLVEEGRDWELLYSAAKDLLRRERFGFLEIKTQLNSSLPGTTGMKCYDHFYNQVLVLGKDLASLWEGFHRTCVRQRIQRAVNDGVRVRTVDDLDGVRDFYRLYMMNARRQLIPPRPFRFFEKIFREFSPNRHVFFLLGEKDGVTGAAGMFFLFNRTMTFEYNAVDYSLAPHSPAHLMTWEAIQLAQQEGCKIFDFGLTPPDDTGLVQFKSRWGAGTSKLRYYYYPDAKGYRRFVTASSGTAPADLTGIRRLTRETKILVPRFLYRHFG